MTCTHLFNTLMMKQHSEIAMSSVLLRTPGQIYPILKWSCPRKASTKCTMYHSN